MMSGSSSGDYSINSICHLESPSEIYIILFVLVGILMAGLVATAQIGGSRMPHRCTGHLLLQQLSKGH